MLADVAPAAGAAVAAQEVTEPVEDCRRNRRETFERREGVAIAQHDLDKVDQLVGVPQARHVALAGTHGPALHHPAEAGRVVDAQPGNGFAGAVGR